MRDQDYFNAVAGVAVVVVVITLAAMFSFVPGGGSPAGGPSTPGTVSYMNLTISINATTGWPQYSPANFTVPEGIVVFTIVDHDAISSWSGCPCTVKGTTSGAEVINGTSYGVVPMSNVAHTFTIPTLGLNVLSPGQSVMSFTVELTNVGTFDWYCMSPCGTDAGGYSGGPMSTPGYMNGAMTVV